MEWLTGSEVGYVWRGKWLMEDDWLERLTILYIFMVCTRVAWDRGGNFHDIYNPSHLYNMREARQVVLKWQWVELIRSVCHGGIYRMSQKKRVQTYESKSQNMFYLSYCDMFTSPLQSNCNKLQVNWLHKFEDMAPNVTVTTGTFLRCLI